MSLSMTNIVGKSMASAHARRYPRLSVRVPVDLTRGGRDLPLLADTLSGGGLFLTNSARARAREGNFGTLSPCQAPAHHSSQGRAFGISLQGQGAAVEFTEISADDRQLLSA